jgi:hypothetical protein
MFNLAMMLQDGPDPATVQKMMLAIVPFMFLFILVMLAIVIVPFWFICKKAGFSPWLSLLNVIPLGNLVLIYVIAFSDWKVMPVPQAYYPPQAPYPPQTPLPPQS